MLTDGFYAEVTLGYDASIAQEKGGRPFGVDALRAIQLSKREVLDVLAHPGSSVIVGLLGLPLADRPAFFDELLTHLRDLRTRTGRPWKTSSP